MLISGKVIEVDKDHNWVVNKTDEDKVLRIKTDDETKFIGPRRGVNKKALNDDRLAIGNQVRVVMKGKTAAEIRLPYRKSGAKDQDK